MAWTSKSKDISATKITPHAVSRSGVAGRAPGVMKISFTPAELFGAGARCSHLHVVNPALVTPESLMVEKLVEQHVDDRNPDFAVLSSADNFKDYVKSYFAGTVASAIAYLAMTRDGYVWSDHFENLGGGAPGATRTPDFVFARAGNPTVSLAESKGTRSEKIGPFDTTVAGGYIGQVEPHLGYHVGTATASHGFCIGSWLTSTTKAELNIHHTRLAIPLPSGGGAAPPADVQRNNYATAFRLAHSESLAGQIRRGQIEQSTIPFIEYSWLGREFLSSYEFGHISFESSSQYSELIELRDSIRDCCFKSSDIPSRGFGLEKKIVLEVLRVVSGTAAEMVFDLTPMPEDLLAQARTGTDGAMFPDGLAVFGRNKLPEKGRLVVWDRGKNTLRPA